MFEQWFSRLTKVYFNFETESVVFFLFYFCLFFCCFGKTDYLCHLYVLLVSKVTV